MTERDSAARTAPRDVCNAESAVGHHCQRAPMHPMPHTDKHGNVFWDVAPVARAATTGADPHAPLRAALLHVTDLMRHVADDIDRPNAFPGLARDIRETLDRIKAAEVVAKSGAARAHPGEVTDLTRRWTAQVSHLKTGIAALANRWTMPDHHGKGTYFSCASELLAEWDRLLAERDAANETARRIAAERETVRVAATKCDEDVRAIGQRYRDDWADFDGRTLKEELIEATWGLDRALSSSPRAESEGPTLTFDDALRIARGCTDYGGGYRDDDEKFGIYQHGIATVIRSLAAAADRGLRDLQIRTLHRIGSENPAPTSPSEDDKETT